MHQLIQKNMITVISLILSVVAGALLGSYFGGKQQLAKSLLVISAGFLITICLIDVFPEVYESGDHNIGLWVIGGVLLQMVLENLTKGFEHGHFHHQTENQILPVALIFGMFIHAFIEGIPLANSADGFSPYLQGIVFHNIPISFVMGAFLFQNKKFSAYSWIIISVFALASPLGMFFGHYFNEDYQPYFLAIVGGIFLHISSVIIFESNKNHNIDWLKIGQVVAGIFLALIVHKLAHPVAH